MALVPVADLALGVIQDSGVGRASGGAVTRHAPSANLSNIERQAPATMKTQPHPSDCEVLAGLVERVTYQNAENGFCVIRVKARSHRDLVTVVGHAATILAGEWITASGDWVNDRTHGQ